jgi:hypothetical protein
MRGARRSATQRFTVMKVAKITVKMAASATRESSRLEKTFEKPSESNQR